MLFSIRALILLAFYSLFVVAQLPAQDAAPAAADPWQRAIGPHNWQFPQDHGAHPSFKTEWWYFTGNVHDSSGRPFGFELALFRQGLQYNPAQQESKWAIRDFYFGNFVISDITDNRFLADEKVSRGSLGEAHATVGKMDTAIGNWSVKAVDLPDPAVTPGHPEPEGATYLLNGQGAEASMALTVQAEKPLVLEGDHGLSQKCQEKGQASYYYSYPRLATHGTITVDGKVYTVEGESWFDHEFSTSSMGPNQVGWDWFCIQLENKSELMLYLMRDKDGKIDASSQGTLIHTDGSTEHLALTDFTEKVLDHWKNPRSGAIYPSGWEIALPKLGATLQVQPLMADQELFFGAEGKTSGYWEGACKINGTFGNQPIRGKGYTELTGYYRPMDSLK